MSFLFRNLKKQKAKINADYLSTEELDADLSRCGVTEDLRIMVFIDRTSSCRVTGKKTFGSQNLHTLNVPGGNPFQKTIRALDHLIKYNQKGNFPVYAYGSGTAEKFSNHLHYLGHCRTSSEVEKVYMDTTDLNDQAKPTCFRFIINEAIRVAKHTGNYYVVLIITDGCPEQQYIKDDLTAIYDAMDYPLSIVCVGVGDGPFDFMEHLDDMNTTKIESIPSSYIKQLQRKKTFFDNFQFVNLHKDVLADKSLKPEELHERAYTAMFMEIPGQYRAIGKLQHYVSKIGEDLPYPTEGIIEEHIRLGIPLPVGDSVNPPAFNKGTAYSPIV